MHKGFAFVQFTNPFDARSACVGEDARTVLGQTLGNLFAFVSTSYRYHFYRSRYHYNPREYSTCVTHMIVIATYTLGPGRGSVLKLVLPGGNQTFPDHILILSFLTSQL